MNLDPYLDLEHGVLRNRLGITDPELLAEAEAAVSAVAVATLRRDRLPGSYDLPHLQHFHWTIFSSIYRWSGQLRTVSLGKNGQMFCPPGELESTGRDVFARLAAVDRLRGLARPDFVDGLTGFFADVTYLHPFREGNGRASRALFAQLAEDAGFSVSFGRVDPAHNRDASRAAHVGDLVPLRSLFDAIVDERA